MNDEFMSQLREEPRREFADALYERLSKQPKPIFAQLMVKNLTWRNAIVAFTLLFLIAACVYAVTEKRWNKVGDIWVQVERTHKVEYVSPPELPEALQVQEPECVTMKEAKEMLRFDFKVPIWAPEGFTLDDRICGIDSTSDIAGLFWKGMDEHSGISMMISNRRGFNMSTQKYEIWPAAVWGPIAPGSYKEVQVHGQPAVLIRGDWDLPGFVSFVPPGRKLDANGLIEAKWDKKRGIQLHWLDGEVMYSLYAGTGFSAYGDTNVSAEDLIRMAESAQ